MKKLLLISCGLLLSYTYGQAQVIVYCESPASVMGNKTPFTWADPASGWGTPDMNIPANAIKDTLMVVDDGTAGDSLGCGVLVNSLAGKIALVYRGSCEFGVKAKNAQDAGAIGVIVVNNVAGAPINMGPGAQGVNVTIPAVMVTNLDGKALRAAIDAGGNVVVFIGNKFGLYNNDLGFYAADALLPKATAYPALLATNATEFKVPLGGWIHNYGISSQTGATITAVISGAGSYSATSTPAPAIAHGDSVYAIVPTYSASSYNKGLYRVNYTINYPAADDFSGDNKFYAGFLIDSIFSHAWIDTLTKMPVSLTYDRFATPAAPYLTCSHFMDANASRVVAKGIYSSAAAATPIALIDGETVDAVVYEWNDAFTGLSDPAFPGDSGVWNLKEVGSGSYTYGSGMERKMVYIPFSSPVPLIDNKRYLFCNRTYADTINLGFDSYYDYNESIFGLGGNDQPVSIVMNNNNTNHYSTGFGTDYSASVSVLFGPNNLGVNEHTNSFEVTPYPNPTSELVKIPMKGVRGTAQLKIMDMNGNVVNMQTVKVAAQDVEVNVTGVSSGNYVFNMLFEDGRNTTFKVVITK